MHVTSKMCMTKDVGMNGNLFGGNMMAWADEAAAIYAHMATLEKRMVTMEIGPFQFKKPVKVGDIVKFDIQQVSYTACSISLEIKAYVGSTVVLNTTGIFVCVNENGLKKSITSLRGLT